MNKTILNGFNIADIPAILESTKRRFTITFVNTRNDHIVEVARTSVIRTIKRRINKHRINHGYSPVYDSLGGEIVYILDKEFFTEDGLKRLEEINKKVWIDGEVLAERGIDFDIWYEYWLDDNGRLEYDTRSKVGDEDDETRTDGTDENHTGTENG